MLEYTTVKIPKFVRDSLEIAKRVIAEHVGKLPLDVLRPGSCPVCKSRELDITRLRSDLEVARCRRCGFAFPRLLSTGVVAASRLLEASWLLIQLALVAMLQQVCDSRCAKQ